MEPILSIITVVFNNENYIGLAIENFLNQNCDDAEMLIIDGASSDNTVSIIKKYASNNSKLRWISEKDSGQSDAMNKALKLAKGKYISFLNVDDYYSEGTLKKIISLISQKKAPQFLVGNCNVWNEKNELLYINRPKKLKTWHFLSGYYLPVNPTAYFYEKSLHNLIGDYNVNNHNNMDIEFLIEASLVADMKYYPNDWGNFRLLPNTKTVLDQQNGLMDSRKKALFKSYKKRVPYSINLLIYYTIQVELLKRILFKLFKILKNPFNMVFWKVKKVYFTKSKV